MPWWSYIWDWPYDKIGAIELVFGAVALICVLQRDRIVRLFTFITATTGYRRLPIILTLVSVLGTMLFFGLRKEYRMFEFISHANHSLGVAVLMWSAIAMMVLVLTVMLVMLTRATFEEYKKYVQRTQYRCCTKNNVNRDADTIIRWIPKAHKTRHLPDSQQQHWW